MMVIVAPGMPFEAVGLVSVTVPLREQQTPGGTTGAIGWGVGAVGLLHAAARASAMSVT